MVRGDRSFGFQSDFCHSGYGGEMVRKRGGRDGVSKQKKKRDTCGYGGEPEDGDYHVTDTEQEEEDDDDVMRKKGLKRKNGFSGSSSMNGDEEYVFELSKKKKRVIMRQMCGICLSEEGKATVRGRLSSCDHFFCYPCILEWAKVESRCPVCKLRFGTITRIPQVDVGVQGFGSVTHVPKRDQVYHPSEEEVMDLLDPYHNTVCTECKQGVDDAVMLLCDLCDSASHTYCVGLGLQVPEGNWYCDGCKLAALASSTDSLSRSAGDNFAVTMLPTVSVTARETLDLIPFPRSPPALNFRYLQRIHGLDNWSYYGAALPQVHYLSSDVSSGMTSFPQQTIAFPGTSRNVEFRSRLLNSDAPLLNNANVVHHFGDGHDFCHQQRQYTEQNLSYLEKKQVQTMVRTHLKNLSKNCDLGYYTFKSIARTSTHTTLAAMGLEHRTDEVYPIRSRTQHLNCKAKAPRCFFYFDRFVKDVVNEIMQAYSPVFSRNC